MRDYVLTCAVMNEQIGLSPVRMLRNWIRRKELARMDAHTLALLNISEVDRKWAVRLRLDIDPFIAIEDRAFRESRKQLGLAASAQQEPDPLPPFGEAAPRARKVILSHAGLKVGILAGNQARHAAASLQGSRQVTPHILDQPIRNALLTRHKGLSEGGPLALRYQPDISAFATAVDDSAEALAALAALVPANSMAILVQAGEHPLPPGMVAENRFQVVQMVAETVTAPEAGTEVLELSDADAPEMLALATLTKPGPYNARTHAFGGYVGVREGGRLAAMAGHRLKVRGYTEISAVCTHPDFRGRGYASHLMRVVAARIVARGETPFLHTYVANANAIRLYEKLGFVLRCRLEGSVLRRM